MKIDLVYMWVDGSDEAWAQRKQKAMAEEQIALPSAGAKFRYEDNNELLFSLRSVDAYAPWINHIYIVTDNQRPAWLDTSNPKVTIVDHSEILPRQVLPCFNSTAIELAIPNIEALSEHFLLANDDLYINAPVVPSDFFDAQGRPIIRLKHQASNRKGDIYNQKILASQRLIASLLGKRYRLAPHHNIDPYLKSAVRECNTRFAAEVAESQSHKFRREGEIHRSIWCYYSLAKGYAVMRKVGRYDRTGSFANRIKAIINNRYATFSRCIPAETQNLEQCMNKYNPALFCINDGANTSDDDRRHVKAFLEQKFAKKSAFEK